MSTPGDRIDLLETFVRIAETGGIGAAARSLDTSQPTVSRRLQQLESLLSAKLVERSTQGLSLTPAGATLLPEAREVIGRWSGLERVVEAEAGELAGLVRLAATPTLGDSALADIVAAFVAQYSGVAVDMRLTDGPVDLVAEGIDFAVREGKVAAEGLAVREVARSRWVLCAAPSMTERLAIENGLSIERCEPLALAGAPRVVYGPGGDAPTRFHGRGGETVDVTFSPVASFDTHGPALRLATLGVGLAILPSWLIAPYLADGRLQRLATDWATDEEPISISWGSSRFHSAAASALLEIVREELPLMLAY